MSLCMEARWARATVACCILVGFAACGGDEAKPRVLTGHFIDAAVAGIAYETETQSAFTGPDGEFKYVEGETVTFSIGALALPPAPAQPIVTPLTLAGTTQLGDPEAVNITRLLLSIDDDGDATNGIQIPAEAAAVAPSSIDFDVPPETFSASETVNAFVASAGGAGALVSDADAVAHLAQNVIVGTYRHPSEPGTLVLLANGRYFYSETGGEQTNGVDVGTYVYDPISGAMAFTIRYETNTAGGLGDGVGTTSSGTATLTAVGDLVLTGPNGELTLYRQPQGTGLEGTWYAENAGDFAIWIFDGTGFVYAEVVDGKAGLEGGTYAMPAGRGIEFTVVFSDNPHGGVYEEEGPIVDSPIALAGNGLDISDPLTGGYPFQRQ